jgi:GNAT superfamily N-acetyltransferase
LHATDLAAVGVHPAYQRRGIGGRLMKWGIDTAESMQLPIYTEASVPGLPLYLRNGFERLTHVSLVHRAELIDKPDDVEIPLVVRMPSAAAAAGMGFQQWADKGYPETF